MTVPARRVRDSRRRRPEPAHPPDQRSPTPLGRRRAVRAARVLAAVVGLALLCTAVAAGLAVLDGGDRSLLLVLLAALAAWAVPLAALGAAVLALARHRRSTAAAVLILAVLALWLRPHPHGNGDVSAEAVAQGRALELTVLTQNVLFGQVSAQEIVTAVRRERPDVLVLTELTHELAADLGRSDLGDLLPHTALEPGYAADGTGIWSALPITRDQPVPGMTFAGIDVTVQTRQGPVRVVGVHPAPPLSDTWQSDFQGLREHLASATGTGEPVVVAGDLNATRYNAPLRGLLDDAGAIGLREAAATRSWAWQHQTWPTRPGTRSGDRAGALPSGSLFPVLRIDHVLVPDGARVLAVSTVRMRGSDHLGVLATARLPRDG